MKKLVVGLVLAFLLVGTMALSAEDQIFASYNQKGHINLYGSVGYGYYYGIEGSVAAEYIIGEFAIGPVPFDWGVMARGLIGFEPYYGLSWGVGGLASLHMGLVWNLDFYASLGFGFSSWWGDPYPGFWSTNGVSYKLSKNLFVLVEAGYTSWTSYWGVGAVLKM
jgi:hypothetical protein